LSSGQSKRSWDPTQFIKNISHRAGAQAERRPRHGIVSASAGGPAGMHLCTRRRLMIRNLMASTAIAALLIAGAVTARAEDTAKTAVKQQIATSTAAMKIKNP